MAYVRIDPVETLDQTDGPPGSDQVAAWLSHLSDKEVLKRMSRLRASFSRDPEVMLRNFETLEGMRDEAAEFVRAEDA